MIAFEVWLNGEKLCLAGLDDEGTLFHSLIYSRHKNRGRAQAKDRELHLRVSGLVNEEHIYWCDPMLTVEVGDELAVKIVEVESADEPAHRHRSESREERDEKVRGELSATRALLPSPLIEGDWMANLPDYDKMARADELHMCVKILANLGELNACAPEFWKALSSVAAHLQMYRHAMSYREKAETKQE